MINRAICEVMMEGDARGRVFTFPVITYNITTDFEWDSPVVKLIMEMTAKYGIPYFANFVNSEIRPEDARSMCCRLRLDNRELRKRGGGLFGANPLTGSIGVVTINLPRIGYLSLNEEEFFARLRGLMDLAKESLLMKRKVIERFTTPRGREFVLRLMDFMREVVADYQEETGQLFNLEATPGEGTAYRLASLDRDRYPHIITAGQEESYYTNSTHLPVGFTDDIFLALDLREEFQVRYTGGTRNILLASSIEREFRTTLIRELHTLPVLEEIAVGIPGERYYLQNFRNVGKLLDPDASFHSYSREEALVLVKALTPYAKVKLRGF